MDIAAVLEEIYTDDTKLYVLSKEIGNSICSNEIKLVDVIEALGPKLTNKDVMDRCQAMNILSAVFQSMKVDYLSEKELVFIVEFLHDRLKDQHLVIPKVIHCINSIITSKNLAKDAAEKLLVQLFKEANIQSHIHKDRHAFFLILEYILDSKIEEIKGLGSDFIMYFIQSMLEQQQPMGTKNRVVPVGSLLLGKDHQQFQMLEALSFHIPLPSNSDFIPPPTPAVDNLLDFPSTPSTTITTMGLEDEIRLTNSTVNQPSAQNNVPSGVTSVSDIVQFIQGVEVNDLPMLQFLADEISTRISELKTGQVRDEIISPPPPSSATTTTSPSAPDSSLLPSSILSSTKDGEKDPRNLLIVFRCVPIILNNFPLGPFLEDFFEVLSCYFPIDFNPVTTGPDSEVVTRDNIADALHICLSHTNSFAPFLIPLTLEKLSSSVVNSKLDALRLLEMCCEKSYLPQDLQPSLTSIWSGLRNEVFMGGNEEVASQSMKLIRAAFAMLSKSPDILNNSIKLIFSECKHHLMEPEMRLMQPASAVLLAIAESAEPACQIVADLVLPLLYEQFLKKTTGSERKSILGFMTNLISVTTKFPKLKLSKTVFEWDEILATWFTLLSHSDKDFVNLALGFFTLISSDLDAKSVEILQCHLLNLLSMASSLPAPDTRKILFNCLETIASNFPSDVTESAIPGLIKIVENPTENSVPLDKFTLILSAVAECSYFVVVAEKVIPFLLEQLKNAELKVNNVLGGTMETDQNFSDTSSDVWLKYLLEFLHCLARVIEKGSSSAPLLSSIKKPSVQEISEFSEFICIKMNVVQVICEIAISTRNRRRNHQHSLVDDEQIYIVANDIVRNVVRGASKENQTIFVNSFWNERVNGEDTFVRKTLHQVPGLLLESLLGPLRRNVPISKRNLLLEELIGVALHPADTTGDGAPSSNVDSIVAKDIQAHIRLFANILNKTESADDFNRFQERILQLVDTTTSAGDSLMNDGADFDFSKHGESTTTVNQVGSSQIVVNLFMWVLKALAMRGFDSLDTWIDKTISLLGNTVVGGLVAEGFEVLMSDCATSLNAESFCNYRFLYRQRLFLSSVPKFVAAYKKSPQDDPCRVNYIRGLSSQLRHVPKTVLHMELNNVLPLLVASLTCADSSAAVRLSSLNALYDLLNDKSNEETPKNVKDSPLAEYYHDVVPHLVKMTNLYKDSMSIRIIALQCLKKCAKFPIHMVLLEKQLVVDKLKSALNDPKRLVRKEAVAARNIWILTGAPGGLS